MTREDIKNRVVEIIVDKIGVSICEIQESTRFKEDLGADSLDMIEMFMDFERVFGIKFNDEEINTTITVCEAVDGICQKLGVSDCKQQQSEVNFDSTYKSYMESRKDDLSGNAVTINMKDLARYFWNKGFNARKEE